MLAHNIFKTSFATTVFNPCNNELNNAGIALNRQTCFKRGFNSDPNPGFAMKCY